MFEANAVLARGGVSFFIVTLNDKDHFIYVLSLLKYVVLLIEEAGLQRLQNTSHEL